MVVRDLIAGPRPRHCQGTRRCTSARCLQTRCCRDRAIARRRRCGRPDLANGPGQHRRDAIPQRQASGRDSRRRVLLDRPDPVWRQLQIAGLIMLVAILPPGG